MATEHIGKNSPHGRAVGRRDDANPRSPPVAEHTSELPQAKPSIREKRGMQLHFSLVLGMQASTSWRIGKGRFPPGEAIRGPSRSSTTLNPEPTAQIDPKGTLGTGSAGLAVGGAYLAVAAGIDHLVAELRIARQDAPVDRAGGGGELAIAAQ